VTSPVDGPPTLLVGHNREPSSDHALLVAVDLAGRLGGRLHIVHTVCLTDFPVDPDTWDWEAQGAAMLAVERRHVEELLADAPLRWTFEARYGDPAGQLADAAAEHDALLIVVGSRGEGFRRALARLVDPSVSHGVIQRQHRPVLVVPVPHPGAAVHA
jgi:nucleotide-binding universal stress UspA family protein